METIMQYIPLAVSAILLAALILTVITNIITQVVKKITWDKIPTNILAVLVAMAVTLLAFFAVCQIMGWAVTWYMVAGAVAGAFETTRRDTVEASRRMARSMIFFLVARFVSAAGARVARTPAGTMESAQATRAFSAFISAALAAISAPCSSTASESAWYSASRASKVASSSTCQSRRAGRPRRSVAPRASRKALSWAAALASAISLERRAWE